MVAIYLYAAGPRGLREIAEQNVLKTEYAVSQIRSRTQHRVLFPAPRFNEFVIETDGKRPMAGLPLGKFYPDLKNATLLCVTAKARKEQIDTLGHGLASLAR